MSAHDIELERLEANFHDELKSFLNKREQGRVMGMYRHAVANITANLRAKHGIGHCVEGENHCVCGGDVPAVRETCGNWRKP
ncbi:hypothetical protein KGP36_05855 [Patescibacteria group bacterium]|nr:hypothetical protein [Patescibacteria group bacterium]